MNTTMNISNNNNSADLCSPYKSDTDISRAFKLTAYIVVGGIGILGNIFIVVLALKYTVRKQLHHLIVNMAVADILVVLMTLCLDLPSLLDHRVWADIKDNVGDSYCKFLTFFFAAGKWLTLVTLLVISIERSRAMRPTLQRSQPYTLRQRIGILACCWLIAMALATYGLLSSGIEVEGNFCFYVEIFSLTWIIIIVAFGSCIYCIIFVLSIVTLRRLSNQQAIQENIPEDQRQVRAKRIASAMKMVLSSSLLYFCCYLPYDISIILYVGEESSGNMLISGCIDWNALFFVFNFLPLINSCFSPCIYLIFLSDFREAAKRLVCRRNSVQQQPSRDIEESGTLKTSAASRETTREDNQTQTTSM